MNWLEEREKIDDRSRSVELAARFIDLADSCSPIIDLAAGNGTNPRFLISQGLRNKNWLLVDKDEESLATIKFAQDQATSCSVLEADLSSQLSRLPNEKGTAVTGSAFLDLVSESWITLMVSHFSNGPMLLSMTPTEPPRWIPEHPLDELLSATLHDAWRADHGFGPALGFQAVEHFIRKLSHSQKRVECADADWLLRSESDSRMLELMIDGACSRLVPACSTEDATQWRDCRIEQLHAGVLQVHWPHRDVLAW